ncbi:MAG: MgtC/SapB family protein [Candidatus Omnitrophica bacterium]|nr:MgtC/SapB family protein [Candidatus Omnitrophota bacterium]
MLSHYQILARLLLATLLGGVIGFEREARGRAAGFRTHILVCIGSALFMMTSMLLFELYKDISNIDPSRMAAQVVIGIGFLGAGTIFRTGPTVKGLTTAASLWAVAGIGLAVGSGFYFMSLSATILVFIILVVFSRIEEALALKGYKKGGTKDDR